MKEIIFREQKTIAERQAEVEDWVDVPINGEIYKAYEPSTNQIAKLMVARGSSDASKTLFGSLQFLRDTVEPEGYRLLEKAFEEDRIDIDDLVELGLNIITEFGERPTGPSSDSSSSSRTSGTRSTGSSRPAASTRARSRSPKSST